MYPFLTDFQDLFFNSEDQTWKIIQLLTFISPQVMHVCCHCTGVDMDKLKKQASILCVSDAKNMATQFTLQPSTLFLRLSSHELLSISAAMT